ncbi:MAG: hypothetical protein R3B45_16500 [Bdellovibrionota bacterium]
MITRKLQIKKEFWQLPPKGGKTLDFVIGQTVSNLVAKCGDMYLAALIEGGEFIALIEASSNENHVEDGLASDISANGSTIFTKASAKIAVEKLQKSTTQLNWRSVTILQFGGSKYVDKPVIDHIIFQGMQDRSEVFKDASLFIESVSQHPVPVKGKFVSYDTLFTQGDFFSKDVPNVKENTISLEYRINQELHPKLKQLYLDYKKGAHLIELLEFHGINDIEQDSNNVIGLQVIQQYELLKGKIKEMDGALQGYNTLCILIYENCNLVDLLAKVKSLNFDKFLILKNWLQRKIINAEFRNIDNIKQIALTVSSGKSTYLDYQDATSCMGRYSQRLDYYQLEGLVHAKRLGHERLKNGSCLWYIKPYFEDGIVEEHESMKSLIDRNVMSIEAVKLVDLQGERRLEAIPHSQIGGRSCWVVCGRLNDRFSELGIE